MDLVVPISEKTPKLNSVRNIGKNAAYVANKPTKGVIYGTAFSFVESLFATPASVYWPIGRTPMIEPDQKIKKPRKTGL